MANRSVRVICRRPLAIIGLSPSSRGSMLMSRGRIAVIFRWLGGMVAEPVWEEDDAVAASFVRDDRGRAIRKR